MITTDPSPLRAMPSLEPRTHIRQRAQEMILRYGKAAAIRAAEHLEESSPMFAERVISAKIQPKTRAERTFGEMSSDEKHGLPADDSPGLSHRARAFQALKRVLLSGR